MAGRRTARPALVEGAAPPPLGTLNEAQIRQSLAPYSEGATSSVVLVAIADLVPSGDKYIFFTGSNSAALATITAYGRSLLTSQGMLPRAVRVVTASGAITVAADTDDVIVVNKTTGAATTVNLPASPTAGDNYTIKDGKADAATNNITLTPAAGTIEGAATAIMAVDRESLTVVYSGTEWLVI